MLLLCFGVILIASSAEKVFNKFYGRYLDVIGKYDRNIASILTDSLAGTNLSILILLHITGFFCPKFTNIKIFQYLDLSN